MPTAEFGPLNPILPTQFNWFGDIIKRAGDVGRRPGTLGRRSRRKPAAKNMLSRPQLSAPGTNWLQIMVRCGRSALPGAAGDLSIFWCRSSPDAPYLRQADRILGHPRHARAGAAAMASQVRNPTGDRAFGPYLFDAKCIPQRGVHTPRLLYVGRLLGGKGCHRSPAVSALSTTYPRPSLLIVGEGPRDRSWRTQQPAGIVDIVQWASWLTQRRVGETLPRRDLCCFPACATPAEWWYWSACPWRASAVYDPGSRPYRE